MSLEEKHLQLLEYYGEAKKQVDQLKKVKDDLQSKNQELTLRVERQTSQLNKIQNAGKNKNEETIQMNNRIRALEEELKTAKSQQPKTNEINYHMQSQIEQLQSERLENLVLISDLRTKNGKLERKVKEMENHQYFERGQIDELQRRIQEEKRRMTQAEERNATEKRNMEMGHKEEVKRLEASLKTTAENVKQLNDQLRNRVDETALSRAIGDLHSRMKDKETYIEWLKEKKDELEGALRAFEQKEKQYTNRMRMMDTELKNLREEHKKVTEELNLLRQGNRDDLEDKTCLICKTEMETTDNQQFEALPKCSGCKRRYHQECISKWFRQRIECPVCRKDGYEMENIDSWNNHHLFALGSVHL